MDFTFESIVNFPNIFLFWVVNIKHSPNKQRCDVRDDSRDIAHGILCFASYLFQDQLTLFITRGFKKVCVVLWGLPTNV